tara:strand:+ start:556 stop:738 length:183 start_codon:yes stop_codon:yes gene_type:complete
MARDSVDELGGNPVAESLLEKKSPRFGAFGSIAEDHVGLVGDNGTHQPRDLTRIETVISI